MPSQASYRWDRARKLENKLIHILNGNGGTIMEEIAENVPLVDYKGNNINIPDPLGHGEVRTPRANGTGRGENGGGDLCAHQWIAYLSTGP